MSVSVREGSLFPFKTRVHCMGSIKNQLLHQLRCALLCVSACCTAPLRMRQVANSVLRCAHADLI